MRHTNPQLRAALALHVALKTAQAAAQSAQVAMNAYHGTFAASEWRDKVKAAHSCPIMHSVSRELDQTAERVIGDLPRSVRA